MSTEESTPKLTHTFEGVLNRNLMRITDAFYSGTLEDCYMALSITIGLLKKKHRSSLMKNELSHLNAELVKAKKASGVDLYWTRNHQKNARLKALRENLFDIYLKLMDLLHKHKYLEFDRHRLQRTDFDEMEKSEI